MTKKICVVGLGYIGLPTAVTFVNHGLQVHGVDINQEIINSIQNSDVYIEEKGLKEQLLHAVNSGLFTVSVKPIEADVFIIAVPSPINQDKTSNLSFVQEATKSIVPFLRKGNLVILESTVPPKTVEKIMMPELEKAGLAIGTELLVAHSPERVIPGKVLQELIHNDRIVGGINHESSIAAKELYEIFVEGKIHITDSTTAELVKVMENTFRDVNIAFANELAKICQKLDVNVWEAIELANFHPRVNIHKPGPGVGGHCIAVDPWFLVELQPELANLIRTGRTINDSMPEYTVERVNEILHEHHIAHGRVAVFGLSFKANIDDLRESPSLRVLEYLNRANIDYSVYDPHIKKNIFNRQSQNLEEVVKNADLLLVLTDHDEFKTLNPDTIGQLMRSKLLFDTKNCINREDWNRAGFVVSFLGNSKYV